MVPEVGVVESAQMLSLPTFVQPVLSRLLGETRIPEGHPKGSLASPPVQSVLAGGSRSGLRTRAIGRARLKRALAGASASGSHL